MEFPLAEGKVLGERYHVERLLGAGGMSVVAVATDLQQGGQVAVKMLLPDAAKKKAVLQRFEREQRTLGQLSSEHAVRYLGTGTESGYPYMLLEYLDGNDLQDVLKMQGALPVPDAVELLLQACEAIAEAHALGIVHRDLKPGNLFLTRRADGSNCVKVLDFGISKASGPQRELGENTLTGTTAILGSPFYMSPEQLISSRDVDGRTDVWSLGVTLHELITNTLPFGAKTTQKVCKRILNDKPTPLRLIRPDMPVGLEAVLLKCLQRRPAERFGNIADLAVGLAKFGPRRVDKSVTVITEFLQPTERVEAASGEHPVASSARPEDTGDAATLHLDRAPMPVAPRNNQRTAVIAVVYGAVMFGVGLGAGLFIAARSPSPATTAEMPAAPAEPLARAPAGGADEEPEEPAQPEPSAPPVELDLDLEPTPARGRPPTAWRSPATQPGAAARPPGAATRPAAATTSQPQSPPAKSSTPSSPPPAAATTAPPPPPATPPPGLPGGGERPDF